MWKAYNFPVYLLSESGISAVQEVILRIFNLLEILLGQIDDILETKGLEWHYDGIMLHETCLLMSCEIITLTLD